MGHDHHHHHHHHAQDFHGHETDHQTHGDPGRVLRIALTITLGFALVEAVGGLWSGSLALLSDAGHMLSDSMALGLAAFAQWIARRPPNPKHSYGYGRAEVVAALVNSLAMLALVAYIVFEAIVRLQEPVPIAGQAVIIIAVIGLILNIVVAWVLSRDQSSLNSRAALLHVMGDLLGSIAAIASGVVIYFTGWTPIDAVLSMLVAGLIVSSTIKLFGQSLHVLMEGVPAALDYEEVGRDLLELPNIAAVHELHIWNVSSGHIALSAHVHVDQLDVWPGTLAACRKLLLERYRIEQITLQPELGAPEAAQVFHDGCGQRVGQDGNLNPGADKQPR